MVEMPFHVAVSERAAELLRAGVAVIKGGAVREIDTGRIIQLLRPVFDGGQVVMQPVAPFSPPGLIGQMAVDAAAAARSARWAAMFSARNGTLLMDLIGKVNRLQTLAWANTILTGANIALTAVAFAQLSS